MDGSSDRSGGDEAPPQDVPAQGGTEPADVDDRVAAAAPLNEPVAPAEFVLPKRRVWPIFVIVPLLLGLAGWLLFRQLNAPLPARVLIAVDMGGQWWEGSKDAALIADRLGKQLEELGFDVVRAGDPDTIAALEGSADPLKAAAKLRAAFVISGEAKPELVELPVEGGFFESRLRGSLRVSHIADREPLLDLPLRGYAGARKREVAQELTVAEVVRLARNAVLPALVNHRSIVEIFKGNDPKLIDQLSAARRYADAYQREMARASGAYHDLESQRLAADKGGHEIHFISEQSAEDRLIATGPGGVLMSTAPVVPYYNPEDGALLRDEQLETVQWRDEAGTLKVLWEGYNLFTYPTAAREGRPILLVEDLYGWARTLSRVEPGAELERLVVAPVRKLSEPRVSPDGRAVAFVDKACRGCSREIGVLDLIDAKHPRRVGATGADFTFIGDFSWLDERRLMLVATARSDDEDRYALWTIDVASGQRSSLMVPKGASLADPTASRDGRTVAAAHVNGAAIVVLDVASNSVKSWPVGGRPAALSFSPDGKHLAFELTDARYQDIAMLDLASGKVTRLTRDDSPDRLPLFSHDSQRIYFEARNTDPLFGRIRAVVRIAWVAVP